MHRQPVSSSNLVSVGYDQSRQLLEIEFKTGLYEYYDVPEPIYSGLITAASHGSYFHAYIKDKYRYLKL